jgi:uncharacterized tellurite resistance protein B-like protein
VKLDAARVERLRRQLEQRGAPSIAPRSFHETRAETAAAYVRVKPFAEAMFLVMTADGQINEQEREVLRGAVRILTNAQLGEKATDALLAELERNASRTDHEDRLDRVASELWSDREDRELAIALMAAMATADEHVKQSEVDAIIELAQRLGLEQQARDALSLGRPPTHGRAT